MRMYQQYIPLFHRLKKFSPIGITFLLILSCVACTSKIPEKQASIAYQRVFPSLSFNNPTTLLQKKGDNSRWYLAEKSGRIYFFENDDNAKNKVLYLDISRRVDESFEGGLLGMAFDPDFDNNGFIYLSYTTSKTPEEDNTKDIISRLSRFSVIDNNSRIDPNSELVLLTLKQPWNNHNGGNIAFGPDSYLYLGFGDGGAWGDQKDNAQNIHNWFGAMLRLDVSPDKIKTDGQPRYAIPADNPFANSTGCDDQNGCPEIYAWGFRNPWRWSFDRMTGELWAGDVGQGEWEEIDRVEKGKNYGWRCYEGPKEYNFENCSDDENYIGPVVAYEHRPFEKARDGMAGSVTGGFVYRGKSLPEFDGSYFFADFVHGLLWYVKSPYNDNAESQLLFDLDMSIVTFAQDNEGELYFLEYQENAGIFKLVPGS